MTALGMDAGWVVWDGISKLFTMAGYLVLHYEWFSNRWQLSTADYTLNTEDDLFYFWVLWILDSQFPASVASHFHRFAKLFNAVSLFFVVLVSVDWIFNSVYADL